jgi:hypothetical protein
LFSFFSMRFTASNFDAMAVIWLFSSLPGSKVSHENVTWQELPVAVEKKQYLFARQQRPVEQ